MQVGSSSSNSGRGMEMALVCHRRGCSIGLHITRRWVEEFKFYGVKGGTEGYVDPRILPLKYEIFRTSFQNFQFRSQIKEYIAEWAAASRIDRRPPPLFPIQFRPESRDINARTQWVLNKYGKGFAWNSIKNLRKAELSFQLLAGCTAALWRLNPSK